MSSNRSFLLLLYKPILFPILTDWIFDVDLCYLDSAFCSRLQRSYLLDHLTTLKLSNLSVSKNLVEYYEWLVLKGVRVDNLVLHDCHDNKSLRSSIEELVFRSKHLAKFTSQNNSALTQLFKSGLVVDSLRLLSLDIICELLPCLYCITELDVSHCHSTPLNFYQSVAIHCVQLKRLIVDSDHSIFPVFSLLSLEFVKNCRISLLLQLQYGVCDSITDITGSLQWTGEPDSSTVTLGGKHYHVVALYVSVLNHLEKESNSILRYCNQHLQYLEFHDCQFTALVPFMPTCSNLTHLYVSYCDIDDNLLVLLRHSAKLRTIKFLRCGGRTREAIHTIAECCGQLETLLVNTEQSSEKDILQLFKRCKHLTSATIGRGMPTDSMIPHLSYGLTSLKLLAFDSRIEISEQRFGKQLLMDGCNIRGNVNFPRIFRQNPLLTRIELNGLKKLRDFQLKQIVDLCPLLCHVYVNHCLVVTMDGLRHFIRCSQLTHFYARGYDVSNEFVKDLLFDKPNLIQLCLPECTGFNGMVCYHIADYCRGIRSVEFRSCREFENGDIITMLEGCPRLDSLKLDSCRGFNNHILPYLKRRMRLLSLTDTAINNRQLDAFIASSGFSCSEALTIVDDY